MPIISELVDESDSALRIQLGYALKGEIARPKWATEAVCSDEEEEEFPSKIGGTPLWLSNSPQIHFEDIKCGICADPMYLLIQIYTPTDPDENAYHRNVYVFICKDMACHRKAGLFQSSKCLKVVREQLCKAESCANNGQSSARLCEICNFPAKKQLVCAGCGNAYYCSKQHQQLHLEHYGHSKSCGDIIKVEYGFQPELVLVAEDEPSASVGRENMLLELRRTLEAMNLVVPSASTHLKALKKSEKQIEEEYDKTHVDVDKAFLTFQKRVIRDNEQVLRYARVYTAADDFPETDKEPLWLRDDGIPSSSTIGSCTACGTPRTFEFQLMPQLLNHLSIDYKDPNSLDFGTIAVYTCPKNCALDRGFCDEVGWIQNPTLEGMNQHFERLANKSSSKTHLDSDTESNDEL